MKISDIIVSGLKGAAIGLIVAIGLCLVIPISNIALMITFITLTPALIMMWLKYIKIQADIEEEKRRIEKNKQRQFEREQLDNQLKLQQENEKLKQRIRHDLESDLRFDKSRLVDIPTNTPSYQTIYFQKKGWESIVSYYDECAKLINCINVLTNEDIYND